MEWPKAFQPTITYCFRRSLFIEKSSQKVERETYQKIVIFKVFAKTLLIFIILTRMWYIVFHIFARLSLDNKLKVIDIPPREGIEVKVFPWSNAHVISMTKLFLCSLFMLWIDMPLSILSCVSFDLLFNGNVID